MSNLSNLSNMKTDTEIWEKKGRNVSRARHVAQVYFS
jgi:hypothetical protein